MNKHYVALELDKVLVRLASFTSCEDAKYEAEHLEPESNIHIVNNLLSQTADAHMLMARFGAPSFGGLRNVNNALSRANAGSTLNMRELLDIAEVLRVIRSLSEWKDRNSGITTSIDTFFYSCVLGCPIARKLTCNPKIITIAIIRNSSILEFLVFCIVIYV